MDVAHELNRLLDQVLNLGGRGPAFQADSALLGAVPELDSMAVVSIVTGLEEQFGITVEDDEIDGATFATFGALTAFVQAKLDA